MNDSLSFKSDDYHSFLIKKIIDLQTQTTSLEGLLKASLTHLYEQNGEGKAFELLLKTLKDEQPNIRKQTADDVIAELKSISNDADDFLKGLLSE